MKTSSSAFKQLLARANRDEKFACDVIKDPEKINYWYQLEKEEFERVASYECISDIKRDFEYCHNLNGVFGLINKRFPVNKFSSGDFHQARYSGAILIILLLIIYLFLPSLPNTVDIGVVDFQKLRPETRLIIVLFIAGYFLINFSFVGRKLKDLETSERITLITAIIVLIVVPAAIVLRSQEEGVQGIFLRIVLVIFFTSLPASFYMLFILNKRKTIWEEFVDNLRRLDPVGHEHLAEIYQKKFASIYGDVEQDVQHSSDLLSSETSLPVYLCTFIIGIGWLFFFFPDTTAIDKFPYGFSRVDDIDASPFTFGFLGAYFFVLQLLFRRYVQSDLKPVAYSQASKRLLSTWIWAFVLLAMANFGESPPEGTPTPSFAILAFVIGVFPEIGWQVISNSLKAGLGLVIPSFRQTHPLNEIDGITIWVQARLLEEDIENVQNLVTANIFDLMLRTNLHPRRIVNWIDRGVLLLHTNTKREKTTTDKEETIKKKTMGEYLNEYGIITASNLIISYKAFKKTDNDVFIDDKIDKIIERMLRAIEHDSNMYHVLAWHRTREDLLVDNSLDLRSEVTTKPVEREARKDDQEKHHK